MFSLFAWVCLLFGIIVSPGILAQAAPVPESNDAVRYLHIPTIQRRLFLSLHRPWQTEFERLLDRPIQMGVPNSYCDLVRLVKSREQDFDVVFMPPHLAAQFVREQDYRPLVYSQQGVQGVLLLRKGLDKTSDTILRVGLPDPLTAISYVYRKREKQLFQQAGRADFLTSKISYHYYASHSQALVGLLKGEVDGVAVTRFVLELSSQALEEKFQLIPFELDIPGMILLAVPGTSDEQVRRYQYGFSYHRQLSNPDIVPSLKQVGLKPADAALTALYAALPRVDISACLAETQLIPPVF
jgi:hypothetical protein